MKVGDAFPDFSLPDQDGKTRSLAEYKGNPFVIYFYPKDLTSGCTVEACEFNEALPDFGEIPVIGVSPDPPKSHQKFIAKHNLLFTLLADETHSLLNSLGIWVEKSMYGKKYMGVERTTYLVGADGKIARIWHKVKPADHAKEVLAASKA